MSNRAHRPSFTMLGFEKSVKSSMSKSDQGPLKPREKWSVGCRKKFWDLVIFRKKNFFPKSKKISMELQKPKMLRDLPGPGKWWKNDTLKNEKKNFFGGATPILGGKYAPCPPILFFCWSILCLLQSCQTATPYLVPSAYTSPWNMARIWLWNGCTKIFFRQGDPHFEG